MDQPATSDNPGGVDPLFIVGLPRTGSTLWSNVIACDDETMRFGEMHFLNPWHHDFRTFVRKETGPLSVDVNVERLVTKLFMDRPWTGLRGNFWEQIRRIDPETLRDRIYAEIIGSDRSLGAVFRTLVTESTRIRGYRKCLIKFPVYVNHIQDLLGWFPGARIMHITRDPRGTVVSKLSDPGGTEKRLARYPLMTPLIRTTMKSFVVIQYRWAAAMHRRMAGNEKSYRVFRYEDLVTDPEATITALCDFAGIAYSSRMLEPRAGQPSSITGEKRAGFDPSSATRWRSRLGGLEADIIKKLTYRAMLDFGYDPDNHPTMRADARG
ncbi:sulfotransferase [Thiohalobacter sp. COW1]|uniref:sulfotransferase family protein n=1 Tax=Thiohalobacter sp. COW1 TaxID=2795687 RepID=UPI0019153DB5|nr:sulfotransferase [Thiohalobacter sp. COW1]